MVCSLSVAETCPLEGDFRQLDVTKATQDLLFRLALVIFQHIRTTAETKEKLDKNVRMLAFCASAGAFISAWQQQQQAYVLEDENAPKAHSMLVERLRNMQKYMLKSYDETTGASNHSMWRKYKAKVQQVAKSKRRTAYLV